MSSALHTGPYLKDIAWLTEEAAVSAYARQLGLQRIMDIAPGELLSSAKVAQSRMACLMDEPVTAALEPCVITSVAMRAPR